MTAHAGSFEVKMTPVSPQDNAPALGRMTVEKQFHGDLEAPAKGKCSPPEQK